MNWLAGIHVPVRMMEFGLESLPCVDVLDAPLSLVFPMVKLLSATTSYSLKQLPPTLVSLDTLWWVVTQEFAKKTDSGPAKCLSVDVSVSTYRNTVLLSN